MPSADNPPADALAGEDPSYLSEQIITYLGNKRALLSFIGNALAHVQASLHKEKLSIFDGFSGGGVVSRYFKRYAERLYVNDLEAYSRCLNECYLTNRRDVDLQKLSDMLRELKSTIAATLHSGFITKLYAPKDDAHIHYGERVFYTRRNAQYIDTARELIGTLPQEYRKFFLAPLLYGASVHTNTAGVFKGFYKNTRGIGQFGGNGRNALSRILGDIDLQLPVFSNFDCQSFVFQKDALEAATSLPEPVDFAYLDPPYNQHPYGSNYFMLNLILDYIPPEKISPISGIPKNWNRSPYNQRAEAQQTLFNLIQQLPAKYILISYNSEGFVTYNDFTQFLASLGDVHVMSTDYNAFRGSRNLNQRDIHVKEFLFLLKKRPATQHHTTTF